MYVLIFLGMTGISMIAGAFIFFLLKYQQKLLKAKLRVQQAGFDHQKQLLYVSLQSQEEERERIGRDLHDEVCGILSNLRLQYSQLNVADPITMAPLHQQLDQAIDRARSISHQLSPPGLSLFGLYETVEELCDQWRRTGMEITVLNEAEEALQSCGFHTILPIYRIVQELLSNTIRHANATLVSIYLGREGEMLLMQYADNGRGLMPDYQMKKGMGMHNILNRAGMLGATYVMSTPGVPHFSITLKIPL